MPCTLDWLEKTDPYSGVNWVQTNYKTWDRSFTEGSIYTPPTEMTHLPSTLTIPASIIIVIFMKHFHQFQANEGVLVPSNSVHGLNQRAEIFSISFGQDLIRGRKHKPTYKSLNEQYIALSVCIYVGTWNIVRCMCFCKFSLSFRGYVYVNNDIYVYMYICQLPPFFPESESFIDYVLRVRRWLLSTELQVLHRCEILEQSSFESAYDPTVWEDLLPLEFTMKPSKISP